MPAKPTAESFDPRIDLYIQKAQPFAQPILERLRQLLHKAVPSITETIKWSHAFFEYKGRTLANMAAFKQHCSLGFWGQEMTAILREAGLLQDGAMGSLGRITSPKDLPSDKQLLALFKQAAAFIDNGQYTSPMAARSTRKSGSDAKQSMARAAKPPLEIPPDLAAALKTNKAAAKVFQEFSPSCQREYIEWLTEAKRQETREKRLAQAIESIAEGKQRHWKYQSK
jgi:uncharacterized protein YdeI (YjbR/CyaY-like superfamily)